MLGAGQNGCKGRRRRVGRNSEVSSSSGVSVSPEPDGPEVGGAAESLVKSQPGSNGIRMTRARKLVVEE